MAQGGEAWTEPAPLGWSRNGYGSLWLEGRHSNREPGGLVQGGESLPILQTFSPLSLLFEPLAPSQDILGLGEADAFHLPLGCETHSSGYLGHGVASLYGHILNKASFWAAFPTIKGQHVTSSIQIHSRAPWIGTI